MRFQVRHTTRFDYSHPVFLEPGDVMRLGVEGLGTQTQRVLQA